MPVENPNNKLKQKLDALIEVPGAFHFNPPAVWSKLEARLQSNSKRRNRFMPFYAAASVLFIIASFIFYRNLSKQETVASPVAAAKNIESKKDSPLPGLKSTGLSPVLKYIEKKQHASSSPAQQLVHAAIPVTHTITPEVITHPVENSFQEPIVFKEKDIRDEISIVIAPALPKMRFKIAHINEVNRGPIPGDIVKHAEKLNYGLSLRKENSFNSEEENLQTPAYSLRKPRTFFSLINSQ
ncbi:MAG TPA: hypothetical protein VMY77_17215 [Chitinophagaceae bacterium]|nr:hypothetical protein [Chitinophagaceae bacterium]